VIPTVSEVKVREGETFESALRRKRKLVAAKKRRAKAG